MSRTITVKGTGSVSTPPDWIHIIIKLAAKHINYKKTIDIAAKQLEV